MQRLRALFAAALSVTLASAPLMGAPTATVWGTVVTAERAHVDDGVASVGTTVFGGDRLSTEDQGSVQIRKTTERKGTAGNLEAWTAECHGGWRDAGY
jgi:hypothetical protein